MEATKKNLVQIGLWILIVCGVLFLIMIGTVTYDKFSFQDLQPPDSVQNIQDFRRWKPELTRASVITFLDSTYYAVQGPFARSLPSAASEYYFDYNGNYLEWNADPGDHKLPRLFFSKETHRTPIEINKIPFKQP